MNHSEQIILYAADRMEKSERDKFEVHLAGCLECQADLELWSAVANEIIAADSAVPTRPHLDESALEVIHRPFKLIRALHHTFQLLQAQSFLIHREMFPASAAVMALGVIVALLSNHLEVIYFIAPMIAAASLSVLFGAEQDPAYELILATATSPWKVLLARLSLISAYNLLLVLAVAAVLHSLIPPHLLGIMLFGWLAPMAFLSALALLLSLWLGTSNAIAIAYMLWVAQYMPYKSIGAWTVSPAWSSLISAYQHFWHNPLIMLLFSVLLLGITLWSTNRPSFRFAA